MKHLNPWLLLPLSLCTAPVAAQIGTLDPSFDTDGIVSTDVGLATYDEANAIALQSDNKILVAGTSGYSGEQDFGLVRYLVDGTPDPDFGTNGRATISIFPGDDIAASVAVQADGAIVLGGYGSGPDGYCFALARLDATGQPDAGFGTGGVVSTQDVTTSLGRSLAIQGDGKILLAGGGSVGFSVVRYNSDGTIDDTFGTAGLTTVSFAPDGAQANAIAIQPDGKLVLAGYSSGESGVSIALARLNSDGTPDTDFANNGTTTMQIGGDALARSMVLDATGRIIVAGSSLNRPIVARFLSNGQPDASLFGIGIQPITITDATSASGFAVAVQLDNKMIVAGSSNSGDDDFLVTRLNEDGTFDMTFNSTGFITTDFTGTRDVAHAVLVQPDGGILLAGLTNDVSADYNFGVTRYLSDAPTAVAEVAAFNTDLRVSPSPLTSSSTITYTLEHDDRLVVDLLDAQGRVVRHLFSGARSAGPHTEPLQPGTDLPAGMYIVRLRGSSLTTSLKVMVEDLR